MYSRCKIGSLKNGIWDLMGFKQVGLESTTLLKKTERELEVFKNSPKVRLVWKTLHIPHGDWTIADPELNLEAYHLMTLDILKCYSLVLHNIHGPIALCSDEQPRTEPRKMLHYCTRLTVSKSHRFCTQTLSGWVWRNDRIWYLTG